MHFVALAAVVVFLLAKRQVATSRTVAVNTSAARYSVRPPASTAQIAPSGLPPRTLPDTQPASQPIATVSGSTITTRVVAQGAGAIGAVAGCTAIGLGPLSPVCGVAGAAVAGKAYDYTKSAAKAVYSSVKFW